MLKLRQKRGVILLSVFLVCGVILTLSCAYVASSIAQGQAAQAQVEAAKAVYLADQGIESAYIESSRNGWSYYTHTVNAGNTLQQVSPGPAAPSLSGWSLNGATGCYEQAVPGGKIEVKTYADPDSLRKDETLVLARASIGKTSRTFRFRISRRSLYRYFIFWSGDYFVGLYGTVYGKQIDGNNIGALHVNGNITVHSTNFRNFSEFSCSGNIYYWYYYTYPTPYNWDRYFWDPLTHQMTSGGMVDGRAPLYRYSIAPYNFYYPLCYDYNLGDSGSSCRSGPYDDPSGHFYGYDVTDDYLEGVDFANTIHGWTRINNLEIPKQLPASYGPPIWSVPKYGAAAMPAGEQPVRFEVTNEALQWLAERENGNNPYNKNEYTNAITGGNWLASGDANGDNQRQYYEFDKITLLSIEQESGTGPRYPPSGPNPDGYNKGLDGLSEYDIYKYVLSGSFPAGPMQTWFQNQVDTLDKFFTWWKDRHYHHRENLTQSGSVYHFSADTSTVPAWERLFWEAWVSYWPPAHGKAHNQVHTPSVPAYCFPINSEWWPDLRYGNDRQTSPPPVLAVRYLNTAYQGGQFYNWLRDKGLDTVVKYANFGGQYETPLDITATYGSLAQSGGLYIRENTGPGPRFTMAFNGATANGSLNGCLNALGLRSWISTAEFYDPYGTDRAYSNWTIPPPPIRVIQLDFANLIASGANINNHLIYLDSPTYDTRIVNAATLPSGGFTLVTPYNVYVKAQTKVINGTTVNAFNYEAADRIHAADPLDSNFQPAAVITNSDLFLLSSEFRDRNPDNGDEYPYGDNFPYYPPLGSNVFLRDYCWDNWPAPPFPARPAAKAQLTPAWVNANLSIPQQTTLINAGEAQWDVENGAKKINRVTKYNIFNLAVSSPSTPLPNFRELWNYGGSAKVEGAFIKLPARWSSRYRSYTTCVYYEGFRFQLPNGPPPYATASYYGYKFYPAYPAYSYQERFWEAEERPSADFFAGSQAVWQELADSDDNFTRHTP